MGLHVPTGKAIRMLDKDTLRKPKKRQRKDSTSSSSISTSSTASSGSPSSSSSSSDDEKSVSSENSQKVDKNVSYTEWKEFVTKKYLLDPFWSLSSADKFSHVQSQLDEPSQRYVSKLIKAHAGLQREIVQLKKDKQALVHVIKSTKVNIEKICESHKDENIVRLLNHNEQNSNKQC